MKRKLCKYLENHAIDVILLFFCTLFITIFFVVINSAQPKSLLVMNKLWKIYMPICLFWLLEFILFLRTEPLKKR